MTFSLLYIVIALYFLAMRPNILIMDEPVSSLDPNGKKMVQGVLNQLRAAVRETEVAATEAFRVGNKYTRKDSSEELNRLSSAIHIMMCMYLAGQYR